MVSGGHREGVTLCTSLLVGSGVAHAFVTNSAANMIMVICSFILNLLYGAIRSKKSSRNTDGVGPPVGVALVVAVVLGVALNVAVGVALVVGEGVALSVGVVLGVADSVGVAVGVAVRVGVGELNAASIAPAETEFCGVIVEPD
jgi:hypothetical protein